jgi:hypothetical protein
LTDMREFIDSMWSDRLTKLKHAAERAQRRHAPEQSRRSEP